MYTTVLLGTSRQQDIKQYSRYSLELVGEFPPGCDTLASYQYWSHMIHVVSYFDNVRGNNVNNSHRTSEAGAEHDGAWRPGRNFWSGPPPEEEQLFLDALLKGPVGNKDVTAGELGKVRSTVRTVDDGGVLRYSTRKRIMECNVERSGDTLHWSAVITAPVDADARYFSLCNLFGRI